MQEESKPLFEPKLHDDVTDYRSLDISHRKDENPDLELTEEEKELDLNLTEKEIYPPEQVIEDNRSSYRKEIKLATNQELLASVKTRFQQKGKIDLETGLKTDDENAKLFSEADIRILNNEDRNTPEPESVKDLENRSVNDLEKVKLEQSLHAKKYINTISNAVTIEIANKIITQAEKDNEINDSDLIEIKKAGSIENIWQQAKDLMLSLIKDEEEVKAIKKLQEDFVQRVLDGNMNPADLPDIKKVVGHRITEIQDGNAAKIKEDINKSTSFNDLERLEKQIEDAVREEKINDKINLLSIQHNLLLKRADFQKKMRDSLEDRIDVLGEQSMLKDFNQQVIEYARKKQIDEDQLFSLQLKIQAKLRHNRIQANKSTSSK